MSACGEWAFLNNGNEVDLSIKNSSTLCFERTSKNDPNNGSFSSASFLTSTFWCDRHCDAFERTEKKRANFIDGLARIFRLGSRKHYS